MFKHKFITRCIQMEIPINLVHILFEEIDKLVERKIEVDYLQVFNVKTLDLKTGLVEIIHSQEVPEYEMTIYIDKVNLERDLKIFVIDENDNATMMLAEEY